jgi:hypothetical protein
MACTVAAPNLSDSILGVEPAAMGREKVGRTINFVHCRASTWVDRTHIAM